MRYVDSLGLKSNTECFILIEPGRGYIVPVLRERFKNSKIIVLHVDNSFQTDEDFATLVPNMAANMATLHGTDSMSVQDFLEKEVPETDTSRIRIIEWRPSLNFYREAYVNLLSQTVEFIKRAAAGKRTVSAFGRRWVKNFFKNLKDSRQALLYRTMEIPVIITGAGPGLEAALPVIRSMQEGSLILAASSSIMALAHAGISADIVITTDGGPWALRHIYPFFRKSNAGSVFKNAAFAANLCAALPSQCIDIPRLIINDGSYWQSVILQKLSLPSVIIQQKGTVTAAAVELALLLSTGNIYLAGMDLSVRDIRTHVKPYAFEHLLFDRAGRFTPVYSESFIRSRQIHDGGSLEIYSAWFKKQLVSWPKRIFSLSAGHEIFLNAPSTGETAAVKKIGDYFKAADIKGDPACFCRIGADALLDAIRDKTYTKNLMAELTPLLFPGEKTVTEKELEAAIAEIACYRKASYE